jgi:hypothetical protein
MVCEPEIQWRKYEFQYQIDLLLFRRQSSRLIYTNFLVSSAIHCCHWYKHWSCHGLHPNRQMCDTHEVADQFRICNWPVETNILERRELENESARWATKQLNGTGRSVRKKPICSVIGRFNWLCRNDDDLRRNLGYSEGIKQSHDFIYEKFKSLYVAVRFIMTVVWDNFRVIHINFLPSGTRVTADYYFTLSKEHVIESVLKNIPGLLRKGTRRCLTTEKYWSRSFRFDNQNHVSNPILSHACYMPCQSHPPWLIILILSKRTSYEANRCAVLSSLLLLHPPWVQIFSSAARSRAHSVCVVHLMSQNKFHTHPKPQVKL